MSFFPSVTPRWPSWDPTSTQANLWDSKARFNVVPAGRRSGKTELAKLMIAMIAGGGFADPRFGRYRVVHDQAPRYFVAAPTYGQARRIYWDDLKAMVPRSWLSEDPRETEMLLRFKSGASLFVLGLDQPARIEGSPWDGGILDEYGNMKESAWLAHVRPALADRNGWCWLIGVPEGRNHYFRTYQKALSDGSGEWSAFSWKSADVLPASEIEQARRDLDDLTFRQEYEADFITFEGRAYHAFTDQNVVSGFQYDTRQPLIVCFDFNVAPGVATILQELPIPGKSAPVLDRWGNRIGEAPIIGSACIGEVWIPRNSNTRLVCQKIISDWGSHQGPVLVYGDATGGSRGSAKLDGSDWDIVKESFRRSPLAEKVSYRIPRHNPPERVRLNAVNSRCCSADGTRKLLVDRIRAPHVVTDFEGVRLLEGGSGEIDKKADPALSHLSDSIGYYIAEVFPIRPRGDSITDF